MVFEKEKQMARRRRLIVVSVLAAMVLAFSAMAQDKAPEGKSQAKALKVRVTYKGPGEVDQSHGIYLFLFDNPDFVQSPGSVMPIAFQSTRANEQSVTFAGLTASTVYLVAAFDEKGAYDITMGAPPSGTPVALYRPGDSQIPTPISLEEGKEIEIKFQFDDSNRMP
jgi:hypothetical protein